MSKYTTQVRFLVETEYDLGLKATDYPIFDETYRPILNKKILDHYYFREIGFETAGLFKFYLNARMREIMPKYNIMYQAQASLLSSGITGNVNITENFNSTQQNSKSDTRNGSTNGTSNSSTTTSSTSNDKRLFQDTPQGNLDTTSMTNQTWATDLTFENSSNSGSSSDNTTTGTIIADSLSSTGNSTDNYIKTIVGNNGKKYSYEIYGEIINKIVNIDEMIINELNDLFMGVF